MEKVVDLLMIELFNFSSKTALVKNIDFNRVFGFGFVLLEFLIET